MLSAQYCAHRARNAPRPFCSSLVASRQAPNLPPTTTNENSRTLPFQTRFRAPSGLFQQCGGERLQLPDLIDCDWRSSGAAGRYAVSPGSNLVPTSAKRLAVITTVEVIGETIVQSRDLHFASRPRSLLHCGNDLLVVSAYKAGRAWSPFSHYPFHLAPDRLVERILVRNCGTLGTRSWRRLRTGRPEQHPLGSSQSALPANRETCFNLDTRVSLDFSRQRQLLDLDY